MKENLQLPKYCDHKSVGVLIYNENNELLLIERGTFPLALAPVAGHMDEHTSYEEAACAEAFEEVGLTITDLSLVAEGKQDNPCRRVDGSWHYWKIYTAKASGNLELSPREAKNAAWYSKEKILELLDKSSQTQEQTVDSIEKVWINWLQQINTTHIHKR